MKVFISWSGLTSRMVAQALRDWIPAVLQSAEPWLAGEDIPAGGRWLGEISRALETTDVGILCLTRDNASASWLHYEAGALSRQGAVCVYALDLAPSDISGPLAQYQVARADWDGTYRLVRALNEARNGPHLPDARLKRAFDLWWPQLESHLNQIPTPSTYPLSERSQDEKIDDILELLRGLVRSSATAPPTPAAPPIAGAGKDTPRPPRVKARPRLFIGSSTEGLSVAEAIQENLEAVAETTVWNQSAFGPSRTFIESLVDIATEHDFAIIVLTPDDLVTKRGDTRLAPRDNLLFELGLFTGTLGRARTFLVHPRDSAMHLPTDMLGVTAVTYAERSDGNLTAAVGPLSTRVKRAMGAAD